MDRSKDPSPFAWILGGALLLVGLAAAASVIRRGNQAQMDDVWSRPQPQQRPVDTTTTTDTDTADVDEMLDGHPS